MREITLPPHAALEQRITMHQEAAIAAEQSAWQARVDSLEAELMLLRTRASRGDYDTGHINEKTSEERLALKRLVQEQEQHRELQNKHGVFATLGKLGLDSGEFMDYWFTTWYECFIGMGSVHIARDNRELIGRQGDTWFYIHEQYARPGESQRLAGTTHAVGKAGTRQYLLDQTLSTPLTIVRPQTSVLDVLSPEDLQPDRWTSALYPLEAAIKRARIKKLIDAVMTLFAVAEPIIPTVDLSSKNMHAKQTLPIGDACQVITKLRYDTPHPNLAIEVFTAGTAMQTNAAMLEEVTFTEISGSHTNRSIINPSTLEMKHTDHDTRDDVIAHLNSLLEQQYETTV